MTSPSADAENLELLLEVGRLLSSKLDLPELLRTVMELAARVVDAEASSILLLDERTQELYFDVALGERGREVQDVRLKVGQGIAGWVAKEGKSLIVRDVSTDSRWTSTADEKSGFKTQSILAVPVTVKGKLLGVVEAINKIKRQFDTKDLRTLEAFASQAAIAIENARLFTSLKEEKEKLETVFSNMHDGAILTGDSGRILLANGSARVLLGMEGVTWENLFPMQGGFRSEPDWEKLLERSDRACFFDWVREKSKVLILTGASIRLDSAKESLSAARFLWVFRDATAERREEKLKRNFLSLLSHKIRTPLVSIMGYTPLLLEEGNSGLNDFQKKAVQAIFQQGRKLSELVDRLLNFAMVEDPSSLELHPVRFPLEALAVEVVQSLKALLDECQAKVLFDASMASFQVYGDRVLLKEALRNLTENAVKFNPRPNPIVELSARGWGGMLEIRVKDNGPGIPSEEKEKLFQKFYQVEDSFTGQVEGWGLGLAFVKRVVEAHGGTVGLESRLEGGSVFCLAVPDKVEK